MTAWMIPKQAVERMADNALSLLEAPWDQGRAQQCAHDLLEALEALSDLDGEHGKCIEHARQYLQDDGANLAAWLEIARRMDR